MSAFGSDKNTIGSGQVKVTKKMVSSRIRQAGEARNFNASSLAKALNIPRSTMQKYWAGDRMLSAEYLFSVSDLLQVNPRWLVTGQGNMEPVPEFQIEDADDEERLLFAFRQLNQEMRDHLIESADLLSRANPEKQSQSGQQRTLHDPKLGFKSP